MIWYAVHPIYIIRLFDRWPGYAALRQIYRRARGRAHPPAGPG